MIGFDIPLSNNLLLVDLCANAPPARVATA